MTLISKLKAATEGSRELSDEVLLALGRMTPQRMYQLAGHDDPYVVVPNPTVSVDDALKLVPGGSRWRIGHTTINPAGPAEMWATLAIQRGGRLSAMVADGTTAATPALALCIAILKTKETERE